MPGRPQKFSLQLSPEDREYLEKIVALRSCEWVILSGGRPSIGARAPLRDVKKTVEVEAPCHQ